MNLRRFFLEAATIIVAAVLCALVANLVASRERKLAIVGSYPNALVVPKRPADSTAPVVPAPVTTTAPADATDTTATMQPMTTPVTTTAVVPTAAAPSAGTVTQAAPAPVTAAPATKPTVAAKASADEMLARFPLHEKVPFVEISPEDAVWLHGRGALFLDARRTSIFEQGHIAGARSFPVWESDIDSRVDSLVNEGRDQRLPIVVYCSGGDCEDSHMLAQKLWGMFFNNVLVYKDGFPDWQKRGGAVDLGSKR